MESTVVSTNQAVLMYVDCDDLGIIMVKVVTTTSCMLSSLRDWHEEWSIYQEAECDEDRTYMKPR